MGAGFLELVGMRTSLLLLCLLLCVGPALAKPGPSDVVKKVYDMHLREGSFKKLFSQCETCFTPGFLGVIDRALAKKPGSSDFVDFDFMLNTQDGGMEYELGETKVDGKRATVDMLVFQRGDYRNPNPDPDWRKKVVKTPVRIDLADVGQGWQISNIVFRSCQQTWPDGSVHKLEETDIRKVLEKIGNSK